MPRTTTEMDNIGQYKLISVCGVWKRQLWLWGTHCLPCTQRWVPFLTLPAVPQKKQDQAQAGGYSNLLLLLLWTGSTFSHIHDPVIVQASLKGNGNQAFTGPVAHFLIFQNIVKVYLFSIVLSSDVLVTEAFDTNIWKLFLCKLLKLL